MNDRPTPKYAVRNEGYRRHVLMGLIHDEYHDIAIFTSASDAARCARLLEQSDE